MYIYIYTYIICMCMYTYIYIYIYIYTHNAYINRGRRREAPRCQHLRRVVLRGEIARIVCGYPLTHPCVLSDLYWSQNDRSQDRGEAAATDAASRNNVGSQGYKRSRPLFAQGEVAQLSYVRAESNTTSFKGWSWSVS